MSYLVFHPSRNNPDCSFFWVWVLWLFFRGGVTSGLTCEVLGSLVLLVLLRYRPGVIWDLLMSFVGILVPSTQSSCLGVVSQCVCVESSSWFNSLNRPDHDTKMRSTPRCLPKKVNILEFISSFSRFTAAPSAANRPDISRAIDSRKRRS